MNRQYSTLWFRLDKKDSYLIWYTDERDGVFVDSKREVTSFRRRSDLQEYAGSHGLSVDVKDPILLDLDSLVEWLKKDGSGSVDCEVFLGAWNLFDDISRSVGSRFDPDHNLTRDIYEKLFWGNNLPAVTPEGKSYHPIWTERELKIIRETLGAGLSMLRNVVRYI